MKDMIYLPKGWEQYREEIIAACGGEGNIRQVKEKFGRLTTYLGKEEYDKATLDMYEKMCSLTCMECGSKVAMYFRRHGWVGPICHECILQGK
ncbi:hypothetical protein [Sinomicrobium sp.]